MSLGLIGISTMAVGSPADAVSTKTVKPDFSYFAGKTISVIAAGSVGGTSWTEAEAISPLIGSYLHATVNVIDMATGGSIPGQNYAAAAPPNGLTIGELLPQGNLTDDVTGVANINFSMEKVPLLGSPEAPASVWFVKPGIGITSIDQLMKAKIPLTDLDLTTGLSNVLTRVFFGAYNAPVKIVSAYANVGTQVAGFVRGDGNVMVASLTAADSEAQAGQALPLLQATTPVKGTLLYSTMKKVPTLSQYYAAHRPSTPAGRLAMNELIAMADSPFLTFFVSKGTPQPYVLALTDAIRSALAQPSAQSQLLNAGLAPGYYSAAVSEAYIVTQVKHAQILARFMNYSG